MALENAGFGRNLAFLRVKNAIFHVQLAFLTLKKALGVRRRGFLRVKRASMIVMPCHLGRNKGTQSGYEASVTP